MATPEEATAFAKAQGATQPFICDPAKWIYQNFNLDKGGFGQMFNPRTVLRGMRATAAGHRLKKPTADPTQLAGTFVIAQDGEITWEHRAMDASDNATKEQILKALGRPSEK